MKTYPITNPFNYPIFINGYLINPKETRFFNEPVELPKANESTEELVKKAVKK